MNEVLTDFRGNTFTVGDTVLYPRMSRRSCEMQEATVLAITKKDTTKWERNPGYDPSQPETLSNRRSIQVPDVKYTVRVMPTRSSRGFYRNGTSERDKARGEEAKAVTIQVSENVVRAD